MQELIIFTQIQKNMKKVITIALFVLSFITSFSQVHNAQELIYIEEVNLLRTDPRAYAGFIREFAKAKLISNNKNDTLTLWIINNELLPLLDTLKPRKKLVPDDNVRELLDLHKGALSVLKARSLDSVKFVMMMHDFDMVDTVSKHLMSIGAISTTVAETIGMSPGDFQRRTIISLLIDRNVPNRGHRNRLLDNDVTGTAVKRVQDGKNVWWIQEFFSFSLKTNR